MRTRLLLTATAVAIASSAMAQAPSNPMAGMQRFAGTIAAVHDGNVAIALAGGDTVEFALAVDSRIVLRHAASMSDLAAGKYVGCTAVEHAPGELLASECHIFPEAMRGVGEGHNPMEPPATSMTNGNIASMTNGSVQSASSSAKQVLLVVTYRGGEQKIAVTPTTRITLMQSGNAASLKSGEQVNGSARKGAHGQPTIAFITIAQ